MNEHKKRILIVENDTESLFLFACLFTEAGFAVDCHTSGLFIVESEYIFPDLFIIGKDLPTIDGIAISKFLRVNPATRKIPIVLISASELKGNASNLNIEEFLLKPLELNYLLKVVEKHILPMRVSPLAHRS